MSKFLIDVWRTYKAKGSLRKLRSIKAEAKRIRQGSKLVESSGRLALFAKFPIWNISWPFSPFYLRSFLFFILGVILTFSIYFFMIQQLNYDETIALFVSLFLIFCLPLSLAFSPYVRSIVSLAIPQICSGKGRVVLLAYIFILAHNGPMRNAMSNFHVLVNSTVCLQHKVANLLPPSVAEKLGLNSDTIAGHTDGFEGIIEVGKEQMNKTMIKFKQAYISSEALFNETLDELEKEYDWLKDKQVACRKLKSKLNYIIDGLSGRLFESWKIVALTPWLPTTVQHAAKAIVRSGFQSACGYEDTTYDFFGVKTLLRERMNALNEYVRQESDLSVHFAHHYSFAFNQSKTFGQVQSAIIADVLNTFSWIKIILNIVSLTLGSTMLLIFFKAIMYRRRYSKSPRFDNFYLSTELFELDRRRELMGLESVLPLRWTERKKYVTIFSPRLVPSERKKFVVNLVVLIVAALDIIYCIALDYAIYWFAQTLNAYGGITITLQGSVFPRLQIVGDGILSSVFRGIADAFDPFTSSYVPSVDLTPCLPKVKPPDFDTYIQIAQLLLVALVITFLGAWLLRLRHVIAAIYNPRMKELRAAHLHRKILIQRTYGLKQLRRNIRKSFLQVPPHLTSGFFEYLTLIFPWFGKLVKFFGYQRSFCLICGERLGTKKPAIRCDNTNCKGVYCAECYGQLDNLCPLCANPLDYGDEVDISEERDSSDDDNGDNYRGVGHFGAAESSDDYSEYNGADDDDDENEDEYTDNDDDDSEDQVVAGKRFN